ncbi:Ig-like domain-containing protein [Marinomonas balearica]|uniref:RapA2 cadherin-like domain-containing protein n=1 Tax=Marinomonas balearica TaxID=491947 RepID=A0A4R6M5U3_9GAMM|nr:hypothetical protein [Marinomonas balearica]TDO96683.1 hypothetical protein DFP79_2445 [Marinomonas balearica]
MTLPTQGAISLKDIALEYSGTSPYSLSDFSDKLDKEVAESLSISEFYGLSAMTILLEDKTFEVYSKRETLIPIANLLAGGIDEYSNGTQPLKLITVQNPQNGTVLIDGVNILFTSTGEVGVATGFDILVENSIGFQVTAFVTMKVVSVPDVVCNPDTFSLQQGETLLLSVDQLMLNDEDASNTGLTFSSVSNSVGGSVSYDAANQSVSFISTGLASEPAEFNYQVQSGVGSQQTGVVYINITPLPELEAFVYSTQADANAAMTSYSPPTMQNVFNTWGRFNGNEYYVNKQDAINQSSSNATAWTFDESLNSVVMPLNVSPSNGFVSEEKVENYTFEATLTSDNGDNDTIGLVAAFVREGSTNHVLTLVLNTGGTAPHSTGCGVYFGYIGVGTGDKLLGEFDIGVGDTVGVGTGWNNRKVRAKVQRQENIVTFYVSHWNQIDSYLPASKIQVDLDADPDLHRFKGAQAYGYITNSQPNSTYLDVSFKGGLDTNKIYDIENNAVWSYQDDAWALTSGSIQSHLGYIRKVLNPETQERYLISESQTSWLGHLVDSVNWSNEKLLNQSQYVLQQEDLAQNGAITGTTLLALYASNQEEKNYLKDLVSVQTTSSHIHDSITLGSNNIGTKNWFSNQSIDLSSIDFIGGTVVFADGTVGRISAIGNDNGTSAFIQYQVVAYRLFDLTL